MPTKIAIGVEYDGTDFVGWQAQRAARSVQAVLSTAVARVADEEITLHGAGRTDSGVHALGQVAHFETHAKRTARQWVLGINSNLPPDVAVRWAVAADASFDARRSATSRRYRYLLLEAPTRPVLLRRRVWWLRETLSCAAMTRAASSWLGEHDFTSFRAAGCQSHTPMRRLMAVAVRRYGPLVAVEFEANAFLQHMVRNMVGTLVEIGAGKAPASWATKVLAARDRTGAAAAAPACGLTLIAVRYPPRYDFPPLADDWPPCL